ncbi:MAG: cellulase N-terminal Ig-like domain-containing protein, partial [Longimicrobiales bacterium]|nr:cellulase N-terminal Ig-like domain-containing protein [Longimicrobiales bacterium]
MPNFLGAGRPLDLRSARFATVPARWLALALVVTGTGAPAAAQAPEALRLNDRGYFHAPGLDVLAFHNWYSGMFSDSKLSGVELIHHGVRVATNGDVRLGHTPEQWDPIPEFEGRDIVDGRVVARLAYPDHGFRYRVIVEADGDAVVLGVELDDPVPAPLEGRAGLNLELLPTAFFGRTFLADGRPGAFPRHGAGAVAPAHGTLQPTALATGGRLVLAPESPERRITVASRAGTLSLYDGRGQAQNGWLVVRQVLPSGRTGRVVEWRIEAHRIPDWVRPPMIAHSQAGYHPDQAKVAVIELDRAYRGPTTARLLRVEPDGSETERFRGEVDPWGTWLRYRYAHFDFSAVTEPGVYRLAFGDRRTEPFVIADNVYRDRVWQPTLDTFFPVQMCHMHVNDRYRVWHGAGHLDDARQAPTDHVHFDLYAQGPTTDSPYEPGEHIPGLNVGGWHDAGDWDIRTQTQYATILTLVRA